MKRGRNTRASTMRDGRQYTVDVDGTIITFECKRAGHRYKIDFGKKHRRLSASGVQDDGVMVEPRERTAASVAVRHVTAPQSGHRNS